MKNLLKLFALMALAGLSAAGSLAGEPAQRPTVIELFTSQSCYSCPPAEAYLGEMAENRAFIALEFHVDYWNNLVHGEDGRWRDVHSKAAFTDRQRAYAERLPEGQSYTPQMVIDGQDFAVGSRRGHVISAIREARTGSHRRLAVRVSPATPSGLKLSVAGSHDGPAAVWLIRFTRRVTTRVRAGENRGKTLTKHNIVTQVKRIADWRGAALARTVGGFQLKPGEGCAILVQDDAAGPILGAAHCPAAAGG